MIEFPVPFVIRSHCTTMAAITGDQFYELSFSSPSPQSLSVIIVWSETKISNSIKDIGKEFQSTLRIWTSTWKACPQFSVGKIHCVIYIYLSICRVYIYIHPWSRLGSLSYSHKNPQIIINTLIERVFFSEYWWSWLTGKLKNSIPRASRWSQFIPNDETQFMFIFFFSPHTVYVYRVWQSKCFENLFRRKYQQ